MPVAQSRRTFRTSLSTFALLLAAPAAAAAQCLATVDTVLIHTAGVTDGGASVADLLHITTLPSVIRRTVLVRAGDCFDPARVAESERALWNLGVFRAVKLDTTRLATGALALRVATGDGWSARPVADYARTASQTTWEAGVFDANFLGTAGQLFASYRSTPDRGWLALRYSTPHLVFPGSLLSVGHYGMTNGRYTHWSLGLPFRETKARYSATLDGNASEERWLIYGEPTVQSDSRGRGVRLRATVAYAPLATSSSFVRLWAAVGWREEGYSPTLTDGYQEAANTTTGAGVHVASIRYRTARSLNTFGRTEWVDLSRSLHVGVWAAPRAFGHASERAGWGLELRSRIGVAWSGVHAAVQLDAWSGYAGGVGDSGQARGRFTIVAQRSRHTLVLYGEGARMLGIRPPGTYDLWIEQRGPRLFAPHAFMGGRFSWLVAEHRVLVRESVAGLIGVGIAPFVEHATAYWPGRAKAEGGNAGLALRLVPLRFAASEVTEVAVGYRYGNATKQPGWAVGVRKGFWF